MMFSSHIQTSVKWMLDVIVSCDYTGQDWPDRSILTWLVNIHRSILTWLVNTDLTGQDWPDWSRLAWLTHVHRSRLTWLVNVHRSRLTWLVKTDLTGQDWPDWSRLTWLVNVHRSRLTWLIDVAAVVTHIVALCWVPPLSKVTRHRGTTTSSQQTTLSYDNTRACDETMSFQLDS